MKFLAIFAVVGFAAAQSATYDVCHNRCSNDLEKCKKECHIEVLSIILFDFLLKPNLSTGPKTNFFRLATSNASASSTDARTSAELLATPFYK